MRGGGLNDCIQVLFSEGNAGVARNVGMKVAQGKYLLFLDADDFFGKNLLSEVVAAAENNEAEIVLFGGYTYDDRTGTLDSRINYISWFRFPKEKVFAAEEVADRLFQLTTPAPWTKLFLREYIVKLGIQFQALPNTNDAFFTLSALSRASRIVGLNQALVTYRRGKKSSSQANKASAPLCFFEAFKALEEHLTVQGKKEKFANTFKWQVLSTLKYSLVTATTDEAKHKIFDYLITNWDGWLEMTWGDDEGYAAPVKDLRKYLLNAIEQYQDQCRKKVLISSSLKCVAEYKCCQEPSISVIVSCYNAASTVQETLQSLIGQSFDDFEIICVDDGSQDETLQILLDFSQQDNRISVYYQLNSGVSVARNGGLSKAKGSYIYFINGGDKLQLQALEVLYRTMVDENLDVLLFNSDSPLRAAKNLEGAVREHEDYCHLGGADGKTVSGLQLISEMRKNGGGLPSACLCMVRKSLLERYNLYFTPGTLEKDNAFVFQAMLYALHAKHISDRFYLKCLKDESIAMSQSGFKNVYARFVSVKEMLVSLFNCSIYNDVSIDMILEVYSLIVSAMDAAKVIYSQLSSEELGSLLALDIGDAVQFEQWIGSAGNDIRNARNAQTIKRSNEQLSKDYGQLSNDYQLLHKDYEQLSKDLQNANAKIEAIERSGSYKLLRKISTSFKKIRKIARRSR